MVATLPLLSSASASPAARRGRDAVAQTRQDRLQVAFSTVLGGSATDDCDGIGTDASGAIYR